jgi:branched-chain amino acid transport system permease protein
VQLTVYALILMAVILWRPTGIMGYLAEVYARRRIKSLSLPAKA